MAKVSLYKNLYDKKGVSAPLSSILEAIRDGKWKDVITAHRNGEVNAKMNGTLPAFTVGGVFHPTRSADNMYKHSGVMSFDLDDVPEAIDDFVDFVLGSSVSEYIYAIFKSTGGKGLCVLVKCAEPKSPHEHKEYYTAFFEELRVAVGDYCKLDYLPDISRLRFVSYDPHLFKNGYALTWDKKVEVDEVVSEATQISMGERFLEDDENKLITYALEKYIDAKGVYGAKGTRHDWILGFARYLCRAGVSESSAISYCLSTFDNSDRDATVWAKEIARCVKSSYARYAAEQGSYAPAKTFDYEAINSASNIEDVLHQLLLYMKDKESYVEYCEKNKKNNQFAKRELQFVKGLYLKLSKYI